LVETDDFTLFLDSKKVSRLATRGAFVKVQLKELRCTKIGQRDHLLKEWQMKDFGCVREGPKSKNSGGERRESLISRPTAALLNFLRLLLLI
jgi:hypothetical protein